MSQSSDEKRIQGGFRAQASGRDAEYLTMRACCLYAEQGWAGIKKQRLTAKVVGKRCVPTKSPVDFLGVLCDGRMIAFDVKSTERETWAVSNLKHHQRAELEFYSRFNAVSGILLRFPGGWGWAPTVPGKGSLRLHDVISVRVDDEGRPLFLEAISEQ